MVRVMMLAPFLIMLSAWLARDETRSAAKSGAANPVQLTSDKPQKTKLAIPGFAIGFVAVVLFNSLHLLPASVLPVITDIDTALLAMAMAALGLSTHLSAIRKAGFKPILLAMILFVWLVVGGALINHWVPALLAG